MSDYQELTADKMSVTKTDLANVTIIVKDVYLSAINKTMTGRLAEVDAAIGNKQDKISVGGHLKLSGGVLSMDTDFIDGLLTKDQASSLVEAKRTATVQEFNEKALQDQEALFSRMDNLYSPVSSIDGDETKCPTVKAVKEAIAGKQGALKTIDGEPVLAVIDQTPTEGNDKSLVSSAGIARALSAKADVGEIKIPEISTEIQNGDYTRMASGGAVFKYVNDKLNGDGVALGVNSNPEPNKLKFGNIVVVDSNGKVPTSLIDGFSEMSESISRLKSRALGFIRRQFQLSGNSTSDSRIDNYHEHVYTIRDGERPAIVVRIPPSSETAPKSFIVIIDSDIDQKTPDEHGIGFTFTLKNSDPVGSSLEFLSDDPTVFSLVRKDVVTMFNFREIRMGTYMVSRTELNKVLQY